MFACCGRNKVLEPEKYKREAEATGRRRKPPMVEQKAALTDQDYRCFYCDRKFGSVVWIGGKRKTLKIEFDHMVPFSFIKNNSPQNFVVSCQICNGFKNDKCFQTPEEARIFILNRWEQKGYL